ncbi:outer membrane beta-barrel protein [Reinekea forsetii]|nr:outer membrane beta-barrel protein [Reinekea forsetii]
MQKHRVIGLIITATLVVLTSNVWAQTPFNFVGGVKLTNGNWSGVNSEPDNEDFYGEGGGLGISAGYQKDKWVGALSLSLAGYNFDGTGPDRIPLDEYMGLDFKKAGASEFDLAFGYRVWPRLYPIFGFKRFGLVWEDPDITQELAGYSVGIAGNYPIGKRFLLFGSVASESMNINIKVDGEAEDIGDARGVAIELGTAYYFSNRTLLQISLEGHSLENQYRNQKKQTHSISTITIGLQRRFGK